MTPVLEGSDRPELSVVMVTHGAWALTQRALAALFDHTPRPFELIVVDNASPDETRARLSERDEVLLIENKDNRGFGPATNQGAALARGEYLLLLNTDAFVHEGWLEPMLESLQRGAVGAVVPRYLHPDGSLQEAGALLAQDGTVLIYGDGDDPDRLCYRFRRVVDFGSAACMVLRRDVWEALGGFDEAYAPAYYEDTDLCMRLAQRGLAVVYDPRAKVTHVRYGSSTSDTAIELSDRNRALLVERWGSHLGGRPWTFRGIDETEAIAARDALAMCRVLLCAQAMDPGAGRSAQALLEDLPGARVTWATGLAAGDGSDCDRWLLAGVEIVDQADPSWLSSRLFRYDLVVLGDGCDPCLPAAAERTQPQALRISLRELERARADRRWGAVLAGAGIGPGLSAGIGPLST
jgi:GT2 family glycosyltransferase